MNKYLILAFAVVELLMLNVAPADPSRPKLPNGSSITTKQGPGGPVEVTPEALPADAPSSQGELSPGAGSHSGAQLRLRRRARKSRAVEPSQSELNSDSGIKARNRE